MELVNQYIEKWNSINEQYADPRTADWFMVPSVKQAATICALYVVYVQIGKHLMSFKKEPFQINNILIGYNLLMVLLSGYMVYEFLMGGWLYDYSFGCQPVDFSNSPQALRMASVCWVFYMSKFVEMADTLFFVLRKKNNQITFLHVFHHGIMPVSWWFGVKFVPGGFSTFHALLNSFIHFLMYFYYGLSACGPQYQKYLWWKKYMTKMQMIQFVMCLIHASQLLFIECNYPILFAYWIGIYAVIFFIFFGNFYAQEYMNRGRADAKTKNRMARKLQ